MSLYAIISFSVTMLIFSAIPGPGVFAIVARGIGSGLRPALGMVTGMVLGDLTYLLFAIYGLSAVAQTFGEFFVIIRYCSGAYLIWLGICMWRSNPSNEVNSPSLSGTVGSGYLITLSNPKVIVFYCTLLPTFLDVSSLASVDVFVACSIVTGSLGLVLGAYAFFASKAHTLFSRRAQIRMNRTAGALMAATGVAITAET